METTADLLREAMVRRPGFGLVTLRCFLSVDIPELARVLGIGTRQAYEAARRDDLPVPTIRLGKRMVVSKDAVERLLGAGGASN